MTTENANITVAHLVQTLDRIEQWLGAVRMGLEALPQDQEIKIDTEVLEEQIGSKQPWITRLC